MATAGMGNKKIATTLGLPQRLRSEGVSHDVVQPRGAEAGVCRDFLAFLIPHLELCVC